MLCQSSPRSWSSIRAFTLIEVMMVVVIVGIMASFVQFNLTSDSPEEKLKAASERFAHVFETAAEYSLLNNIEIGVVISENSYQFLGYDGNRWSEIAEQPLFQLYNLPELLTIKLTLDDLPIEEPLLFDATAYIKQQKEAAEFLDNDDAAQGKKNNQTNNNTATDNSSKNPSQKSKKRIIPQIYIFSGGDISAFKLTFQLTSDAAAEIDFDENKVYQVIGTYSTPLTIKAIGFNAEGFNEDNNEGNNEDSNDDF